MLCVLGAFVFGVFKHVPITAVKRRHADLGGHVRRRRTIRLGQVVPEDCGESGLNVRDHPDDCQTEILAIGLPALFWLATDF